MKKSQRIKTIVDIKATQEKNALEVLGAVQRKLLTMQAQVQGLRNYRQEYQDRFDQMGVKGVNVAQLLEFRSFIEKLDKAIMGQEQVLISIEAEVMAKRKIWEELHHKTQSLQKVCDSALVVEMKQEAKREQQEQDERASRIGRNNSNGTGNA
ncbi:MAG: flagellar export protein FliJ [Methylobacter tundripaludum]|uniref:Flagellar FliJ protein n=1 Tax=Methylobacter tundripaludum TaxID=173365 RepID=A0A2S6GXM2_9GAMM|nr:flagellar export protein FliJ [Methylobacter tundripaludum]MCK9637824.1 flagellar export protein FliJ [Methylobacter tundripaludum]MDD2661696.1 flagellar export protein FliJ [Methylococcales bacterium]PPK69992.1 flagellar FliJ protein [Methylobacter tundripaludum]